MKKPKIKVTETAVLVDGQVSLAKWWMTPSAKGAMAIVKAKKKESMKKFLKYMKAKKAKAEADVNNWKVVPV